MSDSVPIDRSKWKKPIYGGHYDENETSYEGLRCRCSKCGASFVFPPEQQRELFEEQGKYPGWLPSLCQGCEEEWKAARREEESYYAQWALDKYKHELDSAFLNAWLVAAKHADSYGRKGYHQKIGMIKKRLTSLGSEGA